MSGAPVCVLGGGGHAKVVVAALLAAEREIYGIYDDDPGIHGREILGIPVAGSLDDAATCAWKTAIVAVGDNRIRARLVERYRGMVWTSLVHPRAILGPEVTIGEGAVIFAGAIIQPGVVVGRHVIINTGATIDHDCTIGDYVHVAPGCHIAGSVTIDEGAFIGTGGAIIPGVRIGRWAMVGAGAAVVRDVAPETIVVGVPARFLRDIEDGVACTQQTL